MEVLALRGRRAAAIAIARSGRLGKTLKATCSIGGAPSGGPFQTATPPAGLNWDVWLGQAPQTAYCPQRCHGSFRWWPEYSGGKLTDWGAHHDDIAQWAIGMDNSGPTEVEGLQAVHPVPFKDGYPTVDNEYNTATEFKILHFLAKRPGWVFTRYQIVDAIRGPNYPVTERSVDVQVVALRRKLAERGEAIETVRGVGYRSCE